MSGFTNLNSSVSYSQNSTPNGGAAPPYQNGPVQTYPSMYPPAGYYGAPPQQQSYSTIPGHAAPAANKAPTTNNAHSANYYHNNHQQQQQQQQNHLPQHHVAPSPYSAPLSSATPSQPYATLPSAAPPPSNAHYNQQPFQQHPPYATPGSYYGQQSYHPSPAQHPQQQQQQQQHPSLVPVSACAPGAPLYPIVSYPSAPGSSQYGTLSSSQSTSTPGGLPTQILGAPLHQYSAAPPPSTTAVQPAYGAVPPSQTAPTVNGQGSTAQNTVHQHYTQSHQASLSYDSYSGVTQSSGGADTDQPPSGTPSTSVHSSPGHHQGMQYGYVANSGASSASATTSGPAEAAPSSSSSDDDEEEEEDEDEEAGLL